ncbi:separin [Belonocnema kinseyi]|uniref:separin n=1 Tax=Belonocnema kinseyi TaxID=2817044 RepID=UPI00143DF65E|nr:separin [Belonocnema kinseyi]
MCTIDGTIRQILNRCRSEPRASNQNEHGPILLDLLEDDSKEKLEADMKKFLDDQKVNFSVVEYASVNKMLALCSLTTEKVVEGTCYLMEAHSTSLRQQVLHRFTKTNARIKYQARSAIYGLDPYHVKYDMKNTWNCKTLKRKLAELPPEWYVIQVTSQHENFADYKYDEYAGNSLYTMRPTHPIHISIFPTGPNAIEPFSLTLPKPITNNSYDLRKEIESILNKNKSDLLNHYSNRTHYWEMRRRQDSQMKTAIDELENTWLREWRVLFMADPLENLELVKNVHRMIDKLVDDSRNSKEIPSSSRWLLKKVAEGSCFLSKEELSRAVKYLLPNHKKLAKNIVLSVHGMTSSIEELKSSNRKNMILILDENMDHIPFEAMQILRHHPVSRLASIHVTYALYMEYRDSIVDGCKVIKLSNDVGSFIINPSCDLLRMERRLKVFIDYWLPDWKGLFGKEPDEMRFKSALVDHDILMYAGHGSGIQYLRVEDIEKLRVAAIVLLFGCSSLKLTPVGGRQPPFGVSNQYLTACSPSTLGMLWEVTDGDCDKLTATFMSNWIPSENKGSAQNINFAEWDKGILSPDEKVEVPQPVEFEMLRALAKSKDVCGQYMTAAAVIVRGLPIRLQA